MRDGEKWRESSGHVSSHNHRHRTPADGLAQHLFFIRRVNTPAEVLPTHSPAASRRRSITESALNDTQLSSTTTFERDFDPLSKDSIDFRMPRTPPRKRSSSAFASPSRAGAPM
eukprot:scpid46026/ scgid15766/ 